MIGDSNVESDSCDSKSSEANKTCDDGLLKLQLDDSEIPDINIDVTKLDNSSEDIKIEENGKFNKNGIDTLKENINNQLKSNESNLKSRSNYYVWVSNLRHGVKAAEIKKFFTKIGRVTSVKVLTNGKKFYGYVCMESEELANKCISDFNGSVFQGDKITVSKKRPDIDFKSDKAKKNSELKKDKNKESKLVKDTTNKILAIENKTTEIKKLEKNLEAEKEEIDQLKQQIKSLSYSNEKFKQRIDELKHSYEDMRKKYTTVKEEANKLKFQNRQDRRRLNMEKDAFQKTKKVELAKIESDKVALEKDLNETRKLKEILQQKINSIKYEPKKVYKRERSPLCRPNKSPRRKMSPSPRNGNFYRDEPRMEKKFRRNGSRERTPPPPNLNTDGGKKRTEGNSSQMSNRPLFYSQTNKQQLPISYDYRQNRQFANWNQPRNLRRENSSHSHGNNDNRYNGSLDQYSAPAVVAPTRPTHGSYYYPQW